MLMLTSFPEKYTLINHYVESVQIVGEHNDIYNDNTDVCVTLRLGGVYSFTAFTPSNLTAVMKATCSEAFVSWGMIVVARIDVGPILEAVEQCLYLSQHSDQFLGRFGRLQREPPPAMG
jgi:hypothetical protein